MDLDNIKAVVLDLDDTLYSEEEFVCSGFKAVSQYLQQTGLVQKDLYPLMLENFKSPEIRTDPPLLPKLTHEG